MGAQARLQAVGGGTRLRHDHNGALALASKILLELDKETWSSGRAMFCAVPMARARGHRPQMPTRGRPMVLVATSCGTAV